jgi:hypothetical protein
MRKALAGGDVQQAAKVLFSGLEVIFRKGVLEIQSPILQFTTILRDAFLSFTTDAALAFTQLWTDIKLGGVDASAFLSKEFNRAKGFYKVVRNSIREGNKQIATNIQASLGKISEQERKARIQASNIANKQTGIEEGRKLREKNLAITLEAEKKRQEILDNSAKTQATLLEEENKKRLALFNSLNSGIQSAENKLREAENRLNNEAFKALKVDPIKLPTIDTSALEDILGQLGDTVNEKFKAQGTFQGALASRILSTPINQTIEQKQLVELQKLNGQIEKLQPPKWGN